MFSLKQIAKTEPTLAATLAKLQPDSRLYAYRLLLEKAAQDAAKETKP